MCLIILTMSWKDSKVTRSEVPVLFKNKRTKTVMITNILNFHWKIFRCYDVMFEINLKILKRYCKDGYKTLKTRFKLNVVNVSISFEVRTPVSWVV